MDKCCSDIKTASRQRAIGCTRQQLPHFRPAAGLFSNTTCDFPLKSCYKTAASEGKAKCIHTDTWYHLKSSQRGKVDAVNGRRGWPDVFRQVDSLFVDLRFCLHCSRLSGCWMASIEEGSGVTVCVLWICARYIQALVCVCVPVCVCEDIISRPDPSLCSAGIWSLFLFFKVHLERNGSLGQTKLSRCQTLTGRRLNQYNVSLVHTYLHTLIHTHAQRCPASHNYGNIVFFFWIRSEHSFLTHKDTSFYLSDSLTFSSAHTHSLSHTHTHTSAWLQAVQMSPATSES